MTLDQNFGGAAAVPASEAMGVGSPSAAPSDGGGELQPTPNHPVSNRLTAASFNAGSQQLRAFRRAIRDGATTKEAADLVGMFIGEARLHRADDMKNPPPEEAFLPITSTKESDMARTARKPKDDDGEIKPMDFDRVKSLYLNDILPAKSEASSQGQTVAEAMKVIKKQCNVEPQGAKAAFSAFAKEDAHREIHIRSMVGTFNALMGSEILTCNFGDLVDIAEGKVPPAGQRPKPKLVTLPTPPADDSDLADAGGGSDGEEFEMTADELAAQEGRGTADEA